MITHHCHGVIGQASNPSLLFLLLSNDKILLLGCSTVLKTAVEGHVYLGGLLCLVSSIQLVSIWMMIVAAQINTANYVFYVLNGWTDVSFPFLFCTEYSHVQF